MAPSLSFLPRHSEVSFHWYNAQRVMPIAATFTPRIANRSRKVHGRSFHGAVKIFLRFLFAYVLVIGFQMSGKRRAELGSETEGLFESC